MGVSHKKEWFAMEESIEQMIEGLIGYARQLKNRKLRRGFEEMREVRWEELTQEDRARRVSVLAVTKKAYDEYFAMQGRVQKAEGKLN